MSLPFWYREAFHYNPIPTIYCTVWVAIFLASLFVAARMVPGETIKHSEDTYGRDDVVAAGLILGFFWGLFPLVGLSVWLWTGFEGFARWTRVSPAQKDIGRPAVLGILTSKPDPYMTYGWTEVNKIVPPEIVEMPERKLPKAPIGGTGESRSGRTPSQFVEAVNALLNQRQICIMYEVGSIGSSPGKDWPEMRIEAWREKVMIMLPNGKFSPPDDLDEWTFVHYPLAHPQAFDRFLMKRHPMIGNCFIKPEELDEWKRLNPTLTTKCFDAWNSGQPADVILEIDR